jgi:hypothetical protein
MPRSGQIKRLLQGVLEECRQHIDLLLNNGWIAPPRATHAASLDFARKADKTWRFCKELCTNVMIKHSVDPLPYVDQLLDESSCFFSRFFPS